MEFMLKHVLLVDEITPTLLTGGIYKLEVVVMNAECHGSGATFHNTCLVVGEWQGETLVPRPHTGCSIQGPTSSTPAPLPRDEHLENHPKSCTGISWGRDVTGNFRKVISPIGGFSDTPLDGIPLRLSLVVLAAPQMILGGPWLFPKLNAKHNQTHNRKNVTH